MIYEDKHKRVDTRERYISEKRGTQASHHEQRPIGSNAHSNGTTQFRVTQHRRLHLSTDELQGTDYCSGKHCVQRHFTRI